MHINDFKSIVATFADPGTDILFEKAKTIFSVNGILLDVTITTKDGDVLVNDGTGTVSAGSWILKRLANLRLLASRLKESVGDTRLFVSPAATLLPSLEVRPEDTFTPTMDALTTTLQALNDASPLETNILYITSNAGEGKTYLINQMAKEQAQRFLDGQAHWLLVPIPLGGKHFLRFDDIIVGALQNRYRFPFLYYESFLALVRMGVIIPAFDGFEEMFVESSSGEAFSAMGTLVSALDSRGALVVAARKAYFEFESLKTQEKLFDTISSYAVGFGELKLKPWGRTQFMTYCAKRNLPNSEEIYRGVSERLGETHSLLARPVLVRRLVDIATEDPSLDALLSRIHEAGPNFFSVFVRGIIEREAREKWIDRSGERDVGAPLLSVDEHCDLLAALAISMWESRVEFLKRDNLEFVADYYSETRKKNAFQAQQIRARIRGHALLIPSHNASNAVEFDHDEFRQFFLGAGLAEQIRGLDDKAKGEVLGTLRRDRLPEPAQLAFIQAIKQKSSLDNVQVAQLLLTISALDGQASYTQENCGSLIIGLLRDEDAMGFEVQGIAFPPNSLRDSKLMNLTFRCCFFAPTSVELSTFNECKFIDCHVGQLRVFSSSEFYDVQFDGTAVDSVRDVERDTEVWDPLVVQKTLESYGIMYHDGPEARVPEEEVVREIDENLKNVEKVVRYFMRSTHISEGVILMKLGNHGQRFVDEVLSELIDRGIMAEIEHHGGGNQRRFKLSKTLDAIDKAKTQARGSYKEFLKSF